MSYNKEQEQCILKPLQIIFSAFSAEQLPLGESCENCGGRLVPTVTTWFGNLSSHARIIVTAREVPAFKCLGKCRGTWIPPEVTLDLIKKASPIFRISGDAGLADRLEKDEKMLEAIILNEPTHFIDKHHING